MKRVKIYSYSSSSERLGTNRTGESSWKWFEVTVLPGAGGRGWELRCSCPGHGHYKRAVTLLLALLRVLSVYRVLSASLAEVLGHLTSQCNLMLWR